MLFLSLPSGLLTCADCYCAAVFWLGESQGAQFYEAHEEEQFFAVSSACVFCRVLFLEEEHRHSAKAQLSGDISQKNVVVLCD